MLFTVCFKVFDTNHDGKLSQSELRDMVECLVLVTYENRPKMEMVSCQVCEPWNFQHYKTQYSLVSY